MEWEWMDPPWFGDGWRRSPLYFCQCASGVGERLVCGWRFHYGGRQYGQLHCQMEREQLVGRRVGNRRLGRQAAGGGQRTVCGWLLHVGGRCSRQQYRKMGRKCLVGAWLWLIQS